MKLIIVDGSRETMVRTRRIIASAIPDIEVTEYDPEQQGEPGEEFDWSLYDALILGNGFGTPDDGLAWLQRHGRALGFPPVLLVLDADSPVTGARALEHGAAAWVNRVDLPTLRTVAVLHRMVKARVASSGGAPRRDVSIYREALPALTRQTPDGKGIGYRFVRLIGQGEASRVYLGERLDNRSTLVLKIIDTSRITDPQVAQRFAREAKILAGLDSPHVVRLRDHGFTRNYGYIAMEFFTRGDLKQRIEHGVTAEDALNYLLHIAEGLKVIHAAGVVHRDIKPGNIMFRADDSLALADFGISRRVDETTRLTRRGSILGTPNYLSPEQALGLEVDHRADLYCAGIVFFEMLAGHKPFHAESAAGLIYQHVHAPIPRLPPACARFQGVIDRLLAKRPADRPPSAEALITLLLPLLADLN